MTQRFPLGIQGRGQNPEKNDVIKSTDIFERDSLVPGQEPKLREDLTLTVEPNPAGTTQATQIQTTNTDDIMNHSVSLENHLWGTSLSLDAAVESLTKTTDEFEQLKFARESHKSSLNEDFAFESIGDRLKAGIKKVIEYIRAFFKRMRDWIKGERGKAAKAQVEQAKAATKKAMDERTLDEVLDKVYAEMFGENPPADGSRNPFAKANDAGSFQKAADDGAADVYKTFDEIIAGADKIIKSQREMAKDNAATIDSVNATTEEIKRNSEKLSEALDNLYAASKNSNQKFVNEVSRQNVNKFYRQFRDWYGKQNSVIVDEDGGVLAVKTASMEDIAKFIEEHDVEPEIGNALAQALRAAAKVAKFQEDRVKAEATTASAVLSIETNLDKGNTTEGVSKENLTEPGSTEDGQDGAVNTGEGVATPAAVEGSEPPVQVVGDQGDVSLNAPEYLEGEYEGQTDEELDQVIEARAEDLAVAAESLVAQTRVLNKLKSNRVISVGFVTESIQTLGENPFKDLRYYTQLPSRTNYDYSVEALGDKIKEGAKALKEKVVAFLKRVWQWLKGFFVKQKASVEEVQAKAEEQAAELKEAKAAVEEVGEVAKKPVTDTPEMAKHTGSKTVREILREAGIVSPEYKHTPDPDKYTGPSVKVISFLDRGTTAEVVERIRMAQRAVFSANNMNAAMGIMARRFVEHVKSKDLDKATKLVELLAEKISDEEADGTKRPMGQEGYNGDLERHLEKEATLQLLLVVAEHIDMERKEFLGTIAQAAKDDVSVQTLADLTKAVEGMSEENQGPFGSLVSKFTKDFLRASRKVNAEVASVLYNVDSIFPVKPLLEEINRLKKAAPDAKVPGFDLSNESLAKPMLNVETFGKRVPYWERSSKKADAGRSVAAFSMESYPAAPQWEDFSTESFGAKLKEGAVALKDKLKKWISQFWNWLKGLFGGGKKKAEQVKAKVEQSAAQTETKFDEAKAAAPEQYEQPFEEVEELKPILEERAAPIKPAAAPSEAEKAAVPEHKLDLDRPAATIAELLGYAYAEYPARQAAYSDRISKIVIELNTWLAKRSGEFIKAVEAGNQQLADSISNMMREESKKLDKMRQDFRVESSQLNQELVKLMASKPSAHGLRRTAQILTDMRIKMINEAEAQLNSSNKALDLSAYEQVLDKLTPDNQAVFIEIIQRVVNNIQKFVKFDQTELNRTLQSIERDFPVGRVNSYANQFMAKLKGDLLNSIRKPDSGPSNESLRTPFDDVDMESWTGFGLESDSFGEKVKQGAKELKDKLIALFKRVIEWLKNLFRRNKQNAEALKAKVDAAQEKVSEALESVKQTQPDVVDTPLSELEQTKALVENPPEPKPLTPEEKNGEKPAKPETAKQVYQLFGHYMPASMGIYVLEYGNCIEAYRSAYVSYAKVVADIGAAVKQDDAEKLHQIVDAYEAQIGKETEAFDSFRVDPEQTDAGLRRLMEKTPSVSVLEEVHLRVREVYDKLLVNGVDAMTKDTSDSSVAAMSRLISEFMGSNHDLELLGRVTRTFTKWQTKVRTRYEGYSVTASTQIPVYHTYQILQRFKTDTGGSVANESLRKLTRRKPYWER